MNKSGLSVKLQAAPSDDGVLNQKKPQKFPVFYAKAFVKALHLFFYGGFAGNQLFCNLFKIVVCV